MREFIKTAGIFMAVNTKLLWFSFNSQKRARLEIKNTAKYRKEGQQR
jgi:hypothetical protein